MITKISKKCNLIYKFIKNNENMQKIYTGKRFLKIKLS